MTKTIQDAFLQAVQAGDKNDSRVLARYGADLFKAFWHFNNKNDLSAMKEVLDLGLDLAAHNSTLLLTYTIDEIQNEDELARFHLMIAHGAKPDHTTLQTAARKNNMAALEALVALPEVNAAGFDLHKERIVYSANDETLTALVKAGVKLSEETLNDFARSGSQTVIDLHLQAGIKPTHKILQQTLYGQNTVAFDRMFAAMPKENWTQENLDDILRTAVFMTQVDPFRTLIKMGAKVGSSHIYGATDKAEEMHRWPERFGNQEDVITLYKECHKLARKKADPKLCKMPQPREYVSESYSLGLRYGPL